VSLALVLALVAIWLRPSGFAEGNEFVRTIAQVIGGFALLAGLYFTAESVRNSATTLDHQRVSEMNERFFKSVELLGKEEGEGAHIGALFALEQLANESDEHYHQVIGAICAFVRSRSGQVRPDDPKDLPVESFRKAPQDIYVAMTVLGRRRMDLASKAFTSVG
jgi:hypothetical protein